jgi:hypothetical protein
MGWYLLRWTSYRGSERACVLGFWEDARLFFFSRNLHVPVADLSGVASAITKKKETGLGPEDALVLYCNTGSISVHQVSDCGMT